MKASREGDQEKRKREKVETDFGIGHSNKLCGMAHRLDVNKSELTDLVSSSPTSGGEGFFAKAKIIQEYR